MRHPLALLAVIFLLLASAVSRAAPEFPAPPASGAWLNGSLDLLEDPDGNLAVEDLEQTEQAGRFVAAAGRTSVGLSRSVWWLRLDLPRREAVSGGWWLEVASASLHDLRLYLPDERGGFREHRSGEAVPFAEGRDHAYRHPLFQLPPGDGSLRVYLRSYDPGGNAFPLRLWSHDELLEYRSQGNLLFGMAYGLILALLLYNLILFTSLRDRAYFWYVLTAASALVLTLSISGHGFEYFWPARAVPWWLDRLALLAFWGICVIRFSQNLLQSRQHARWAHHLLNACCLLFLACLAFNAAGWRWQAAGVLALTLLANLPIAIGLAVQRWRQGSATARLYLIGFGLVLGSVSLGVMRATALVQPTSANAMVFPLALTLEALLFSLALASRIQDLKQERALALDQADQEKNARLALLHSAQRDLARAVEVRTNELSEANRQLQMREAQLQYAAHHDPLTGLGNRRHLMEFAESALDDARRHGNSMALLLIDLDHFKPINDTHGHDAGDFVLQNVAQRLRHCVRTEDCVARLGGDEFAVLVGGTNAEQHARDIAERLLRELAKPVEFAKQWLVITPSIGVALFPGDALQFGKLYKAADQALYRVKGAGRAGYAMAADDERETAPALPWPTTLAPERIS
ncbi:sensor domain-containing diguanylate cyclase [Pseudomonas aeruginosa]|uniref:diguanylate cyclase n=1 Tax=Pseudomonas aeruginosa TaxID=287 RepID=UPI00071B534D|nr:diguanylate cyclase [Pseudomonas aeruginosa]KSM48751.1 sensor domain-containing diguanylate cyclase [Pseudomonas aeruginosa]